MALGLGQNWKRVRSVIHIGRGDPASIAQGIGRCGRDDRPGLGIIFVEKNRKNGKNTVDQFTNPEYQNKDDRMDALAVTMFACGSLLVWITCKYPFFGLVILFF
jgi:superfamily II DNA helicase RecQ